jgi:gamma-glutamyl:cysteine ligase YbdK (ATP-grasp superfamily)
MEEKQENVDEIAEVRRDMQEKIDEIAEVRREMQEKIDELSSDTEQRVLASLLQGREEGRHEKEDEVAFELQRAKDEGYHEGYAAACWRHAQSGLA